MASKFKDRLRAELKKGREELEDEMLQMFDDDDSDEILKKKPELNSCASLSESTTFQPDASFQSSKVDFQEIGSSEGNVLVKVQALPFFNYSLHRVGVPLIEKVRIQNRNTGIFESAVLEAGIKPLQAKVSTNIPSLSASKSHTVKNLFMPVDRDQFRKISEPERGSLTITLKQGTTEHFQDESQMIIHPYNHCIISEKFPMPVATFIMPGCDAVEFILDKVMEQQETRFGSKSLADYQKGPAHVREICESIYYSLRDDFHIGYISAPHRTGLEMGGQRIFTPDKVLKHRRGTCLDLAMLFCSILERCGLESLLIFGMGDKGGHAWIGCLLERIIPQEILTLTPENMIELVERDLLLSLNSIDFSDENAEFEQCVQNGEANLTSGIFNSEMWGVHIANCRQAGAAPMEVDG